MSEPLYTCPFCERSGFTHRGLSGHWCRSAPANASATKHNGSRLLTKREISKIVVDSSLPPHPTPSKP